MSESSEQRVGGYALGKRLAVGGMAELFEARSLNRSFNEAIVLKRMLPHLSADPRFVEMFIDEARISSSLEHPNIVRVLDFEATEQGLCLIMELIDGPDMLTVLKRCLKLKVRMPKELAVYVACHTLEALDYAHTAESGGRPLKIVHRDVSPSNILITRRGRVKLADFGIAKAAERPSETAAGTLKGKYSYMSPEQVEGKRVDHRSDVFSMGIVLAEALMGRRLFIAPNDFDTLLMVRKADLSRWERLSADVPAELDAIVRKSLLVNRDDRFSSAAEFRDALAEWLSGRPKRTSANGMGQYIGSLEERSGSLCDWGSPTRIGSMGTFAGPDTRMERREDAMRAERGRQAFATAQATRVDGHPGLFVSVSAVPHAAAPSTRVAAEYPKRIELTRGSLEQISLPEVLAEVYRQRTTGSLALKSGEKEKKAYFVDGQPEYVASNLPGDRLGEFLLRRGEISQNVLSRALKIMHNFGGFAETLVQLGVLKPVDAVRALSAQVKGKLLGACDWESGEYSFTFDERNPTPGLALGIDTAEIIGEAVHLIPRAHAVSWAREHQTRPCGANPSVVTEFALDNRASTVLGNLNGKTVGQVLLKGRNHVADLDLKMYALWRAGALQLGDSVG